jgi:hypothetical protein
MKILWICCVAKAIVSLATEEDLVTFHCKTIISYFRTQEKDWEVLDSTACRKEILFYVFVHSNGVGFRLSTQISQHPALEIDPSTKSNREGTLVKS